MITKKELI